jgi:hypothetical protein
MLVIAAESDDAVPLKSLKAFASARGLATLPIEHVDRWSVRAHRSFLQLPKGASDISSQLDFAWFCWSAFRLARWVSPLGCPQLTV